MRAIIGVKLLTSHLAQPATKPFEIYDNRLPGFTAANLSVELVGFTSPSASNTGADRTSHSETV